MSIEFKDSYQALGVGRNDTDPAIKKAFRAFGRQFHPDVAKNTPNAVDTFNAITEANEVLSGLGRASDGFGKTWRRVDEAPITV